jgi:hypothetical protein
MDLLKWEQDKNLYVFTSLSSGSSHIVTATNRIETILRSARIPFTYVDTATNDSAKALFQRRGKGKKLPFLVKEGFVIGDLDQVEEWNEFGELKEAIGPVESKETSIVAPPAKYPAAGPSFTRSAAAPLAGAVPTPTKQMEKPESSSPPAPTPGATAIPTAAMSTLALAAQEIAARAKAKQAALSASVATEPKEPAPTPASVPAATSAPDPEATKPAEEPEQKSIEETTKVEADAPKPTREVSADVISTVSSITSTSSTTKHGHISPTPYIPEHFEPPATTHRGSSVSLASQEEIREVERRETIMEEPEDEEEEPNNVDLVADKVKEVKLADTETKPIVEEAKKVEETVKPPTLEEKKPESTS